MNKYLHRVFPRYLPILAATMLLFSACQEEVNKRFEREAHEYSDKHCPMKVHADITLDSLSYSIADHAYYYYYTVTGDLDNPEVTAQRKSEFRDLLLNGIKNDIDTKKQKEEGVTFNYIYRSGTTGEDIIKETFTKTDYNR